MQIQSNAIVLTSQGISFLHAGVEFMRSKPNPPGRTATDDEHAIMGFIGNSYESPDVVNQLRWDQKALYHDVFEYYKSLIEIRNTYSHFRMNSAAEILSRLTFLNTDAGLQGIAYRIAGNALEPDIVVIHSSNPSSGLTFVELNDGKTYQILSTYEQIHPRGIDTISGSVFVPANTTMILVEQRAETIEIINPMVVIEQGESFNPASNVQIKTNEHAELDVYYSNYHDINRPGYYTITVAVVESFGRVTHYHYTLFVRDPKHRVQLNPQD
jgi:pullulanase